MYGILEPLEYQTSSLYLIEDPPSIDQDHKAYSQRHQKSYSKRNWPRKPYHRISTKVEFRWDSHGQGIEPRPAAQHSLRVDGRQQIQHQRSLEDWSHALMTSRAEETAAIQTAKETSKKRGIQTGKILPEDPCSKPYDN
jgi:hypothetical protein